MAASVKRGLLLFCGEKEESRLHRWVGTEGGVDVQEEGATSLLFLRDGGFLQFTGLQPSQRKFLRNSFR